MSIERCINCDEPTGRAGEGEDSIFAGDVGPLCEDCYESIKQSVGNHFPDATKMVSNQVANSPDLGFEEFKRELNQCEAGCVKKHGLFIEVDDAPLRAFYDRIVSHSADASKMVEGGSGLHSKGE